MSLEHSPAAYTVGEFCKAHRVSRSWLYQEWKAGRGPRVRRIGTKIITPIEAALEWRNADLKAPVAA